MGFELTDGSAVEHANTLADAVSRAEGWYDFMSDDERYEDVEIPSFNRRGEAIESVEDLNRLIGEWEEKIAEACGRKAFHGHGNYSVSAASEMGLHLAVKEGYGSEEDAGRGETTMTTASEATWTIGSKADAQSLANEIGAPVVFVTDAANGFIRELRDGEDRTQAVNHFEEAGELATGAEVVNPELDEDDRLVCGSQIQIDRSGVGHNWRKIDACEIPASIREEIEGEMLDGGQDKCEDFVGSNGLHYRW